MFWKKKPPEWAKVLSMDDYKQFQKDVLEVTAQYGDFNYDWEKGALSARDKSDGKVNGLHTLAQKVALCDQEDRRGMIEHHFDHMFSITDISTIPQDEFRQCLRFSFYHPEMELPCQVNRDLIPQVQAVLVYSGPKFTQSLNDEVLNAQGLSYDQAKEIALSNLRAIDPLKDRDVVVIPDFGLKIITGEGNDFDVASIALHFDTLPDIDPRGSYFFGIPNRHVFVYAIAEEDQQDRVMTVAQVAYKAHEDGPGSITPAIYSWKAGEIAFYGAMGPTK